MRAAGNLELRSPDDLMTLRAHVLTAAGDAGVEPARAEALTVAANEIATNVLVHGGGSGAVSMAYDQTAFYVEIADHGPGFDQNLQAAPNTTQIGGRGLWMASRLCDHVDIDSSAAGTVVRLGVKI